MAQPAHLAMATVVEGWVSDVAGAASEPEQPTIANMRTKPAMSDLKGMNRIVPHLVLP